MSVVVIGGNDRMASRYKDICESYRCKATNTCSHKMVNLVNQKSEKHGIPVARIHNASVNALKTVLEQYAR